MPDDLNEMLILEPGGFEPFDRESPGQTTGFDGDVPDDFDPFLNNL